MKILKSLDQIAKVLVKNKVSFIYDGNQIEVTDKIVSSDLLLYCSLHRSSKQLVFIDRNYKEVLMGNFKHYFNIQ